MQDRFWTRVDKRGADDCWTWLGKPDGGYGRFKYQGRLFLAHRVAYELGTGPVPDDLVVDHVCFNRICVNPKHLQLLSRQENAGRHKPSCTCSVCQPERVIEKLCKRGHDKSLESGNRGWNSGCLTCRQERNKLWMREYRASKGLK